MSFDKNNIVLGVEVHQLKLSTKKTTIKKGKRKIEERKPHYENYRYQAFCGRLLPHKLGLR